MLLVHKFKNILIKTGKWTSVLKKKVGPWKQLNFSDKFFVIPSKVLLEISVVTLRKNFGEDRVFAYRTLMLKK